MTRLLSPGRTRGLIATTVGLTLLSSAVVAGPAFADLDGMICLPATSQVGVNHIDDGAFDIDIGSPLLTVVRGALPDGVQIVDLGREYEYNGAPTRLGEYDYTLQAQDNLGGPTRTKDCHVTVVATLTIDSGITVSRVDGPDRYAGSVAVSKAMIPGTEPLVYLASGENFADALSAGAVAAERQAPLLLSARGSIPTVVVDELKRLKPANVVVMGGELALSAEVVGQLNALPTPPTVTRIGGADRYEVSRNLIADTSFGPKNPKGIFLATGRNFPDALSAAPAAARSDLNIGVLLVDGSQPALSPAETAALTAAKTDFFAIAGGEAAVSSGLESSAQALAPKSKVLRMWGADRFLVSGHIAEVFFHERFTGSPSPDTVYLATGENYPDALAGAPLAVKSGSPLMLAKKDCIPPDVAHRINRLKATKVVLLGGDDVLTPAVANLTVCRP